MKYTKPPMVQTMKLVSNKLFAKKQFTLKNGKTIEQPKSNIPLIISLLTIAILIAGNMTGFDLGVLVSRISYFFDILQRMVPPDWTYLSDIWQPLIETLAMSVLGSVIGAIAAIPAAFLASSNIIHNKIIIGFLRFFLGITRTLPTLVTALIAVFVFNIGSFAGTVAIAIFTFSFIGKLLYQQIETVDMGPYEALEAMGATRVRAFLAAIAPQILPTYLANCLYCFEGSVRYSAILGYVGAGGLGLLLNEKLGWKQYDKVGMILLTLLVTVSCIEILSRYFRKKLS